jgi:hypothetical protein
VSNSRYPAHGKLQLSLEGQLLIIKGTGPANVEMVQEYQRQVIGLRTQIMHSPWASLVLLSGTPLVSPEARVLFVQIIKQAKSMHLSATALVFVNIEFAGMAQQFWQEIYQEAGVNYDFFETEEEARDWLKSRLGVARNKNQH